MKQILLVVCTAIAPGFILGAAWGYLGQESLDYYAQERYAAEIYAEATAGTVGVQFYDAGSAGDACQADASPENCQR